MAVVFKKKQNTLVFLGLAILSILLYKDLLYWFFFKTRFPYEGWDFIVPVLSIIFCYLNYQKLKAKKIKWKKDRRLGSLIIFSAFIVYLLSLLGLFYYIQTISLILFCSGLLFYFGGYRVWIYFAFPIFFLLFKLPWGYFMLKLFGTEQASILQAQGVAFFSSHFGVPSSTQGVLVIGPRFGSEILPRCTGWYTIDAKLLVGTLFLYVSKNPFKIKIYKWLALIPAIMFINFLRILFLHISWNLFISYAPAETIHTYINHLHKIMLFVLFYLLAFGNDFRRKNT